MAQSRGLGRGLSALIPGSQAQSIEEITGLKVSDIPVSKIAPNKNQPRHRFSSESLAGLADSIREIGIIQPIIIRSIDEKNYEIVSGERRFRAVKMLNMETIPCIITRDVDDLSSLQMALIENIHRDDLTPIELSHTFRQLIEEFKLTHEELSKRIGKSRTTITNYLRLLMLPGGIQKMVDDGDLSAGHARALLGLENKSLLKEAAGIVSSKNLSVRETERLVSKKNQERPGEKQKPSKALKFKKIPKVERNISDFLKAPVKIKIGKKKGKIEIIFGSLNDFERIVNKIIENR